METPEPKYIPPSGLASFTSNESRIPLVVETYPDEKKEFEKAIASKWVAHLNMPGRIELPDVIAPDVIYREATPQGEIIIPIELMELVCMRDARLRPVSRAYMKELKKTDGLQGLFLSFCCEEMVGIPYPSKPAGKILLEEIREAILSPSDGTITSGEMLPGHIGETKFWIYLNSTLKKQYRKVVQIFLSIDGTPVGINYGSTQEDWISWGRELNAKFLHDYSLEEIPDFEKSDLKAPVLLLHGSHARPDFDRLSAIVDTLRTEPGNPFAEIWYTKLYPGGEDYFRVINA